MEIGLALVSALLFALGSVLQQKAGLDEPTSGASPSLLLRMARRPVWLVGIASDAVGFVAQAAALGIGRLAVVQPVLVTSVVFALPLGVWISGQQARRRDVGAAAVVVMALIAFLAIANPSGGRSEAPLPDWLIVGIVCVAVCVPLTLLGHRGPHAAPGGDVGHSDRSSVRVDCSTDEGCRGRAARGPSARSRNLGSLCARRRRLRLDDAQPARAEHRRAGPHSRHQWCVGSGCKRHARANSVSRNASRQRIAGSRNDRRLDRRPPGHGGARPLRSAARSPHQPEHASLDGASVRAAAPVR